jgi:hypothetical protein
VSVLIVLPFFLTVIERGLIIGVSVLVVLPYFLTVIERGLILSANKGRGFELARM